MMELENARILRKDVEDKQANQSKQVNLWIKILVDIVERLTAQVAMMGMEGPIFSVGEHEVPSAKPGLFFNELVEKLKTHEEGRADRFTSESRKLARNAVHMVLRNIAYCHPDHNLANDFRKLPEGAYVFATEEKADPFDDKVLTIPRAS